MKDKVDNDEILKECEEIHFQGSVMKQSPSKTLDELTNKIIKIVSRYQSSTSGNDAMLCALQLIHDLALKVEPPSEEEKEVPIKEICLGEIFKLADKEYFAHTDNRGNTLVFSRTDGSANFLNNLEKSDQEALAKAWTDGSDRTVSYYTNGGVFPKNPYTKDI